jgi:hypothetical protein
MADQLDPVADEFERQRARGGLPGGPVGSKPLFNFSAISVMFAPSPDRTGAE